jgi:starch phosphorylase
MSKFDAQNHTFLETFERERRLHAGPWGAEDCLRVAAGACRELLADRWIATQEADAKRKGKRRVHYLSMEFLMGRATGNAIAALGLDQAVAQAAGDIPVVDVLEREHDAALGNGGLGRLAACFLDSFATLGLASFGYGLRYDYGMFAQGIDADGRQVERPEDWQAAGTPWEIARADVRYRVAIGNQVLLATAFDFIVPGHGTERVSTLRLWKASAADPIDFQVFCRGEHVEAGRHRLEADAINWILYPDDSTQAGRELRLKQEFVLVSASIQDMLARHLREHGDCASFGRHNAIHLNDTHPALAPVELMRLLIDEHGVAWDDAWRVTTEAVSYTNHTLMPEALETWPVSQVERMLPRHAEIVREIDRRFLEEARRTLAGDTTRHERLAIIGPGKEPRMRMASLAIVASHKVNGVSALHSRLMTQTIFNDYAAMWPRRFENVTNGVTPRRWLAQANPRLARLLDDTIGRDWRRDLGALSALAPRAGDARLREAVMEVKAANKRHLAERIRRELGLEVDPASLFDVQAKRFHEYKRQLLNVLQVVARYHAILANPRAGWTPRTVVFAGKAASAYRVAKEIIHLIHDVARRVNSDPRVEGLLKVAFLPNYGVSLAEAIMPAADLSEQISTAGTEASGTGNMKFAMNGALTIGTWDGANIEMAEAIGEKYLFIFGLRAAEVELAKARGYDPRATADANPALKEVLAAIAGGAFSPGDPQRHRGLIDGLLARDQYLLLADFADYLRAQARADELFGERSTWADWSVRNIAGMGPFSVDRTIAEYDRLIWNPPEGR